MNIMQMRYVYEVAKTMSMNKAAEKLNVAQPNISRQIKALENEIGITIFERSAQGMRLTAKGEEFVGLAKGVLDRFDAVEKTYSGAVHKRSRFSLSLPRATYLSEAFTAFTSELGGREPLEMYYCETNSGDTIKNVTSSAYDLGIVRYAAVHEKYFEDLFGELKLSHTVLSEFFFILVMSKNSPLARLSEIHYSDLSGLTELTHADPFVPTLPFAEIRNDVFQQVTDRKIYVFERGSQFDLLSNNTGTFMWVSPIPDSTLERYDLVQRSCADNSELLKDVLIYRKNYSFTDHDKSFIRKAESYRDNYLGKFVKNN